MRLLLFVLCVWVFVGVVRQADAACLDDAVPRGNARPIRFAHINSPEATLLTSVVAQLLTDTLGITSTLSVADSLAEVCVSPLPPTTRLFYFWFFFFFFFCVIWFVLKTVVPNLTALFCFVCIQPLFVFVHTCLIRCA